LLSRGKREAVVREQYYLLLVKTVAVPLRLLLREMVMDLMIIAKCFLAWSGLKRYGDWPEGVNCGRLGLLVEA